MKANNRIILCVDDDADDQQMVQETIKQIEPAAQIVSADNGQQALDYLHAITNEADLPCLIIMDINMPLVDGKQAVARLRNEARFASIPVVMFTTSSSLLDRTFCARWGVPFLTKPISQKELYTLVKKMLGFAVR